MKAVMVPKELSVEARKKAATKRIQKAESLLYQATEIIAQAQSEISVICTGLHKNWSKMGKLRSDLKSQMYDLESCRGSGNCQVDETTGR